MSMFNVNVDENPPSYSYSPLALALVKCFKFGLFEKYVLVWDVFWVRELLVWVACFCKTFTVLVLLLLVLVLLAWSVVRVVLRYVGMLHRGTVKKYLPTVDYNR
jgi:hypothetical protein